MEMLGRNVRLLFSLLKALCKIICGASYFVPGNVCPFLYLTKTILKVFVSIFDLSFICFQSIIVTHFYIAISEKLSLASV